jgi:hypothetical protein
VCICARAFAFGECFDGVVAILLFDFDCVAAFESS